MQYTRLGNTGLIVSIGTRHRVSPAQVALAWLLSRPFITSLLVGASKIM